ncbi:MAG: TetR/AcrR family transcriptional regulator [Shewanella sp.]
MIELAVPEHLQLRKQPKQKRSQALIANIIDCTEILVRQLGYQAVNTNTIAQRAGIHVKSLYEFFPNKEAILYYIADQWLLSLRKMCIEYEAPQYLTLDWRSYFWQLHQGCRADGRYEKNYNSLQGLWDLMPEFIALDEFHRQFLIAFHIKHFRRFGAKQPDETLTTLCHFLMGMEDGLGLVLAQVSDEQAAQLSKLHFDTICFHFEHMLEH